MIANLEACNLGTVKMKKIVLALTALAALTGSASAADIAARPYKAPEPVVTAPSWTGFYIFGGGGGGLWAADQSVRDTVTNVPLTIDRRQGGSGWFGTVGLGYDWQFNGPWVFGLFADGQFGSIKGTLIDPLELGDRPDKVAGTRGRLVRGSAIW